MIKESLWTKQPNILMWVVIAKGAQGDNGTIAADTIKFDHAAMSDFLITCNALESDGMVQFHQFLEILLVW